MDALRNPLLLSLPAGRWFGVPMRLSALLLMVMAALLLRYSQTAAEREAATPSAAPPSAAAVADPASAMAETDPPDAAPEGPVARDVPAMRPATPDRVRPADRLQTAAAVNAGTLGDGVAPFRGLMLAGVLLVCAAVAVFAEAAIARHHGSDEAVGVVWPVGGQVVNREPSSLLGEMATAAAVPLTHLSFCVLLAPLMMVAGDGLAFHPFRLPEVAGQNGWIALGLLAFTLNWKLLLVSLLPLHPLPGGRMIQAWRADTRGRRQSTAIKWALLSLFVGLSMMAIAGPGSGNAWLTLLGGGLLAVNAMELIHLTSPDSEDDAVFGYDFSAGYTSLERDEPETVREPSPGPLQRWRAERDRRRREREQTERAAAESELDRLLEKISRVGGVDKLSPDEQRTLKRLSSKFRT